MYEPRIFEQKLHRLLADRQEGKEWFRLSLGEAARYIWVTVEGELLLESSSPTDLVGARGDELRGPVVNPCKYKSCEMERVHTFEGQRYCLWHFREVRNPRKAAVIRLFRSVECRLVIPAGASCAAGTRLLPTSCFRPRSPCGHSGPRQNGRRAPLRPQHGLTACRRPLQIFSAGSGIHPPSPLRKSARALRLPRTTGPRSALHGRQRLPLELAVALD